MEEDTATWGAGSRKTQAARIILCQGNPLAYATDLFRHIHFQSRLNHPFNDNPDET